MKKRKFKIHSGSVNPFSLGVIEGEVPLLSFEDSNRKTAIGHKSLRFEKLNVFVLDYRGLEMVLEKIM